MKNHSLSLWHNKWRKWSQRSTSHSCYYLSIDTLTALLISTGSLWKHLMLPGDKTYSLQLTVNLKEVSVICSSLRICQNWFISELTTILPILSWVTKKHSKWSNFWSFCQAITIWKKPMYAMKISMILFSPSLDSVLIPLECLTLSSPVSWKSKSMKRQNPLSRWSSWIIGLILASKFFMCLSLLDLWLSLPCAFSSLHLLST